MKPEKRDVAMRRRAELIETLNPRQAMQIVQYMTALLAELKPDIDDLSGSQQVEGLNLFLAKVGHAADPPLSLSCPSEHAVGLAARQLLHLLAESEDHEQMQELDHWIANPPTASSLAVVEVAAAAAIYTACTVLLQTRFDFKYKDGKVTFSASRASPKAKAMDAILATLRGILQQISGTNLRS